MSHNITPKKGSGLIEVVVGAAILILVVVGISNLYRLMIVSTREVVRGTQAQLLAEEGVEAVRVIRDGAWSAIASTTSESTYALVWQGGTWTLVASSSPTSIDGVFRRGVVFTDVYRDNDDDISSSGTLDSGTRRVDVFVEWAASFGTSTREVASYITNIFE